MGKVIEDVGKIRLVLHHQDTAHVERCLETVIVETRDLLDRCLRYRDGRNPGARVGRRGTHRLDGLLARFDILQRQDQAERAALPRRAGDVDRAAEQRGQVAGNRQAQACPAITTIGGAVGLAKGFENDFLLIVGNADPRIADNKGYAVVRRRAHGQADSASLSELHGV
ncbi:hypothetical protein D3C73_1185720 [compost metagenome]